MRILFLTPYLGAPPESGGRIRLWHLLRALAARHQVVNVSGFGRSDTPAGAEALKALGIEVVTVPLEPRFGALSFGDRLRKLARLAAGRSSLAARFRSPALAALVRERASAADLVVVDHAWMGVYRPEIGQRPIVYSAHNVESAAIAAKAGQGGGVEAALARAEARALSRFEAALVAESRVTVAVSEEDRQRFLALSPGSRVEVVENGVDLASRPLLPTPPREPFGLLYVGGYDYAPNAEAAHLLATRVLPEVRRTLPRAELELVGRDPEGALSGLGSRSGVRVRGHVPDVVPSYAASQVLVAPLTWGGGSRLKILEAWALGRPVVTTPEGAEGLEAEDGVHLLLGRRPEELAQAVLRIAADPALVARLVAAGRRRVEERHDWGALGSRFAEILATAAR